MLCGVAWLKALRNGLASNPVDFVSQNRLQLPKSTRLAYRLRKGLNNYFFQI